MSWPKQKVAHMVGRSGVVLLLCLLGASAQAQVRAFGTNPHPHDPLTGPVVADPLHTGPAVGFTRFGAAGAADEPEFGQPGKDVIWIPTSDSMVRAMLSAAGAGPRDRVVDLGSGDGRIPITAAREYGATALGIEYDPKLVALARANAARAGVSSRASFVRADIFDAEFSDATIVTMYLLPSLNLKLRSRLLAMQPGTRIVSNSFGMGEWQPERSITTPDAQGFLWIVPAQVAGRWAFEMGNARFATEIGQKFQMLTMEPGSPLKNGRLNGRVVQFVRADGQTMSGEVGAGQMRGPGWMAVRIDERR